MKYILLLLSIILFTACNKLKKEALIIEETIDSTIQKKEPIIEEEKVPEIIFLDTTSHMDIYQIKLENSKYQYEVTVDSSYWYKNTQNGFSYFKDKSNTAFDKIRKRLKKLDKSVSGRNAIFLNSKLKMRGNFRPRGRVIEYIFKNDSIAQSIYDQLMQVKKDLRKDWEIAVDWKCPAIMILKDNRIYHIITGGHYMMGMENEIATVMFEKNKEE
ncbi:hypothetical protein [Nonlabens ulvanivorans]|uniref:hypothetical protein n=1 Tax=Nonlabens ulvanivorans TaxID=906888 RepID=UPI0029437A0A|nr:hypothetical protein [Nonlabens ulvanivorans]WOI24105.1 hypothetical protein R1T42_06550 [Nonlabens ulvanivorans]